MPNRLSVIVASLLLFTGCRQEAPSTKTGATKTAATSQPAGTKTAPTGPPEGKTAIDIEPKTEGKTKPAPKQTEIPLKDPEDE